MKIRLRGKWWKVLFKPLAKQGGKYVWGTIDMDARTITFHSKAKGQNLMDVVIHEGLHACFWDIDEEAIDQSAQDITRLLVKLGFKQDE